MRSKYYIKSALLSSFCGRLSALRIIPCRSYAEFPFKKRSEVFFVCIPRHFRHLEHLEFPRVYKRQGIFHPHIGNQLLGRHSKQLTRIFAKRYLAHVQHCRQILHCALPVKMDTKKLQKTK